MDFTKEASRWLVSLLLAGLVIMAIGMIVMAIVSIAQEFGLWVVPSVAGVLLLTFIIRHSHIFRD